MKGGRLWMAAVCVAVLLVAAVGLRQLAHSRTIQLFGTLVARVDVTEPVVALTFDDGPASARIDGIIAVLAARGVRATFFLVGDQLAAAPEAGRKLVRAGHQLGNHSYSHTRMIFKSPRFIREELERTDALIRATGYNGDIYFRPPYGYKFLALPWILKRTGRTSITWDVEPDSYPEVAASPEAIAAHVVERVRPGSIIILHVWYASRQTSFDAVALVIGQLRAKGYRFVTVGDLLQLRSSPGTTP